MTVVYQGIIGLIGYKGEIMLQRQLAQRLHVFIGKCPRPVGLQGLQRIMARVRGETEFFIASISSPQSSVRQGTKTGTPSASAICSMYEAYAGMEE